MGQEAASAAGQVRNVYLAALREEFYANVEYLIAVDTDMCTPWPVPTMTEVLNALWPATSSEWQGLSANGICDGRYQGEDSLPRQPTGIDAERPWSPVYCDLFALKDGQGRLYMDNRGGMYSFRTGWGPGTCGSSPEWAAHNETAKEWWGCEEVRGEVRLHCKPGPIQRALFKYREVELCRLLSQKGDVSKATGLRILLRRV